MIVIVTLVTYRGHVPVVLGYLVADEDGDDALGAVEAAIDSIHGVRLTVAGRHQQFDLVTDALLPPDVPGAQQVLQAQRNASARYALLEEVGALSAEEVADLAGSKALNRRATAHRWREDGRAFSVRYKGRRLFPAFQFDPVAREPRPVVADVLHSLPREMDRDGWELALWWTTPSETLQWERPVDLVESDPVAVVRAAEAERLDWQDANPGPE